MFRRRIIRRHSVVEDVTCPFLFQLYSVVQTEQRSIADQYPHVFHLIRAAVINDIWCAPYQAQCNLDFVLHHTHLCTNHEPETNLLITRRIFHLFTGYHNQLMMIAHVSKVTLYRSLKLFRSPSFRTNGGTPSAVALLTDRCITLINQWPWSSTGNCNRWTRSLQRFSVISWNA